MSAFQTLMDTLHVPLFNYLVRLLRNRDDAEDALQEVWLKVIKQQNSYDEQGRFIAWIYRIAHNHCLDLFRRHKRMIEESTSEAGDGVELLDRIASPDQTPREILAEKEQIGQIEHAVDALPELIREVYLLRAVHDVPFKDIAEIQNAPLGTVLSRMHQAVNYLKKAVAQTPSTAQELA